MTNEAPRVSDQPAIRLASVAAAGVAVAAATLTLVGRSSVLSTEERIFRMINDAPAAWWPLAWPPMQLGNLAAPVVVAAIVAARTRRRAPVAAVLAAGYGAWAAAQVAKNLVRRDRPGALLADVVVREPVEGPGFVSGHAAISAALATALWPYLGARGRVAAIVLAGLVGVGRVYSGAHLPLDVVGGQAIGALVGLGVTAVVVGPDARAAST